MFAGIDLVITTTTIDVCLIKICADRMSSFLESVAIIQLYSPAFLAKVALEIEDYVRICNVIH
jgi:hypothetical protein